MLKSSRSSIESFNLPIRGNRCLRVSLVSTLDGAPEQLSLTIGWSDPWRPGLSIDLPAAILPDLQRALLALDASRVGDILSRETANRGEETREGGLSIARGSEAACGTGTGQAAKPQTRSTR